MTALRRVLAIVFFVILTSGPLGSVANAGEICAHLRPFEIIERLDVCAPTNAAG